MFGFYLCSLFGLSKAVDGIPVGIAYAVWSGLGTLLVAIIGTIWFGEQITLARVVSTTFIILGVGGLYMTSTNHS
jgi:small multidrug resistance pump